MKYFFLFLFSALTLNAGGFPKSAETVLDSSLRILMMSRVDLAMPWDAVKLDRHRTPLQKSLFENPLKMGDIAQGHLDGMQQAIEGKTSAWFSSIMGQGNLGNYDQYYLRDELSAKELDIIIGKQLEKSVNLTTAFVIRQYAGPLLQAIKGIKKQRAQFLKDSILIHHADSLLMLSEDAQHASVYALKRGEITGNALATSFFERANPPKDIIDYGFSLAALYPALYEISKTLQTEYAKDLQPITLQTPYGRIAIGSHGNDVYSGDYLMILDPAGDDIYQSNTGKMGAMQNPIRCIIDFDGNDMYAMGDYALGSGYFGIGLNFDFQGNDTYRTGNFSLGCGVFGFGYSYDAHGADIYASMTNAQGMGSFGVGLLVDAEGNDAYTVQAHGQAFAATRGVGILADQSGNDVYSCSSPFQDFLRYDSHFESFVQGAALGFRPIASGGLALLLDKQGNDSYLADIYGQGTGYWFGFGALIDDDGEDMYKAYQYAQGSGVHFAQGLLWDKKGSDNYLSHGVSQGCGHDIATGILLDESGNDSYTVESLSLGAGNANAISLFMDIQGDDSYAAINTTNTMGYSDFRRNYGMIGIFADGSGNDLYTEPTKNNRTSLQSTYGIFLDANFAWEKAEAKEQTTTEVESSAPDTVTFGIIFSELDSLFIRASAAPQKYQKDVEPARAAIVSKGKDALPYLLEKFGTASARERLALEAVLPKIYAAFPEETKEILIQALQSDSAEMIGMSAAICGKLALQAAIPALTDLLQSSEWRIRAMASQQLGEIGNLPDSIVNILSIRLQDEQPMVRARAAYSIGKVMPRDILALVRSALFDELQLVRNSTIRGMAASKKVKLSFLNEIMQGKESNRIKELLAELIISIDTSANSEQLTDFILKSPTERKKVFYKAMASAKQIHGLLYWQSVLGILQIKETVKELVNIPLQAGMKGLSAPKKKKKAE